MGGLDKGLQPFRSVPLARHAALRLAPQVGELAINANRHVSIYSAWGWPVWSDADPAGFQGPLAGMLAGLRHAATEWIATVPCDAPEFPSDLVARLCSGVTRSGRLIAYAASPGSGGARDAGTRAQPTFCLMHRSLGLPLDAYIQAGGRKVMDWLRTQDAAEVRFESAGAFFNANTLDDLAGSQGS